MKACEDTLYNFLQNAGFNVKVRCCIKLLNLRLVGKLLPQFIFNCFVSIAMHKRVGLCCRDQSLSFCWASACTKTNAFV